MRKNTPRKTTRRGAAKRTKKTRKASAVNFEPLETRQMLATVNVADFGAKPNDGGDDRSAVLAAINASKPGDTILFSGGTYNFNDYMTWASDRTYKGINGATLRGRGQGNQGQLVKIQGDNVTVTGLTFQVGGLFFERPGGTRNNNILVDYNRFEIDTSGNQTAGITFTSGLNNSKITNNFFTTKDEFGIYGYNYMNLTIANNEFVNVGGGMHIDAFGNSGNLLVEQNYISGAKGMGMEFQSTASNLKFLDNVYEKPNLSSDPSKNMNSFAFSLILDKSSNIEIKRNKVIAPERPDGKGCRIAFEVGGDNTVVEDNYVNGVNHVIASNDGVGTSSILVKNNKFMNYLQGPGGIRYSAMRFEGTNDASTKLTWDINRPNPGIGAKRYGSNGGGGSTNNPAPAPTPSEVAPAAPTELSVIATGATTAKLFWSDRAYNETGFKIERSTDGSTWTQIDTVGANAGNYTATGLKEGTKYHFRVRAYNSAGNSGYTNSVSATPASLQGSYISDMPFVEVKNGWGAAERDTSNGEQASGDGLQMSIGGTKYAKGLGVHSDSEIRVALDGKYSRFLADIGIDDETQGGGSVVFHVYADGVKLYESGTMLAGNLKSVNVDVSGRKELVLLVSAAKDNIDNDHANWANARLLPAGANQPAPQPEPQEPEKNPNQVVYVGDLNWTSASNGWGLAERNRSNGEKKAGDGRTLTINGKTYAKGIGAHSNSQLHYALDGKYATFSADIGIDDEVGDKGSVTFQVWADGIMLYESGKLTGADNAQTINVNVQGRQELWLVVTDAGDDKHNDHANWADARLTTAARPTVSRSTYLSTLTPTQATNGWGKVEIDSSVGEEFDGDGALQTLNGQTYTRGLGVHSNSKLVYQLAGAYSTFISDLGIDDEVGDAGSVVFEIYTDGTKVYDSGVMTGKSATKTAVVNVAGVNQLWLVVNDAGDGTKFDHANWANARLAA